MGDNNAFWQSSYPDGVAKTLDFNQLPDNLAHFFEQSAQKHSDNVAFESFGTEMTYQGLSLRVQAMATFFREVWHLKPGDKIALMMPNCLQYPVAIFAAWQADLVVVNVNPLYQVRECHHQLKDAGVKALIVFEQFSNTIEAVHQKYPLEHIMTTKIGDELGACKGTLFRFVMWLKRSFGGDPTPTKMPQAMTWAKALGTGKKIMRSKKMRTNPVKAKATLDDIACLQYTGGTTGVSKGAMLTHRNLLANLTQVSAWVAPFLDEGKETVVTPCRFITYFHFRRIYCFLSHSVGVMS